MINQIDAVIGGLVPDVSLQIHDMLVLNNAGQDDLLYDIVVMSRIESAIGLQIARELSKIRYYNNRQRGSSIIETIQKIIGIH